MVLNDDTGYETRTKTIDSDGTEQQAMKQAQRLSTVMTLNKDTG